MPVTFDGAAFSTGITVSYQPPVNTRAIFGYGGTSSPSGAVNSSLTNLVSSTGVVASDVTGVGTARAALGAASYGGDKAIFGYGSVAPLSPSSRSMTNLVSNTGVVATDTPGVGEARSQLAAAPYGTDKAIFGTGSGPVGETTTTNLVSNTGVVAANVTGAGTAGRIRGGAGYGTDKAIFGYGIAPGFTNNTNLVSNTGVVASETPGVGTARYYIAAACYGTDKAIFGYGQNSGGTIVSMTNLVSNTGVVATDTTGVGTARQAIAAATYGTDKAIFGYGQTTTNTSSPMSILTNLVSNTGVVASDTPTVATGRYWLAAASFA